MKLFLYCILSLCMIQSVFAEELVVPGVDTSKGIGVNDVKYNADGSMGVGDMKYDKNGASAGNMWVDKNNARVGNLVASGGMDTELTPLKNAPISGSASPSVGKSSIGWSASATAVKSLSGEKLVVGNNLPKTGLEENFIIFFACLLSAGILYRTYRKNVF